LTLVVCAISVVVVPVVTAAEGEASSRHIKKHHQRMSPGWAESWAAREVRTTHGPYGFAGSVCPGNARSFDCKIWPPPFEDDADRKSGDGGGE
jgi:hypothetical protein